MRHRLATSRMAHTHTHSVHTLMHKSADTGFLGGHRDTDTQAPEWGEQPKGFNFFASSSIFPHH